MDEEATVEKLKALRNIIRTQVEKHNGRVFGSAGDSTIAEFTSPVETVRCAVTIQNAIANRIQNADPQSVDGQLHLRIGINLGDVIVDGDNLLGDGVNIAARLETLAGPGEVFISRSVLEQVRKQLPFSYDDIGEQRVKNIADPISVYRVNPEQTPAKLWQSSLTGSRRLQALAAAIVMFFASIGVWWFLSGHTSQEQAEFKLPDLPSIAVLSLDTFGDDKDLRFLAEGISEDIITQLARNTNLIVMARTATFSLKDKGLTAKEISDKLNVKYALEGSVRRSGDKLRVTTQLIEAKTGKHVWAEHYDFVASAVFTTQDDIVEKIVGTLLSEIREVDKANILRRPPSDLDVYQLTLNGLALKHKLNPKDTQRAIDDLRQAVKLDPGYAPAWLYLGWEEALAIVFKWPIDGKVSTDLKGALAKIEKAIELDSTLATAYQALGLVRTFTGDAQGALEAAKRSVELGPGDADNLLVYARALASNGDFDASLDKARYAMALNPYQPSYYSYNLGRTLWGKGEYKDTLVSENKCLTKAPEFTACRLLKIAAYIGMDDLASATKAVKVLLQQSPTYTVEDALKAVGFPGSKSVNARLANQLTEAGLPLGKGG